MRHFLKTVLSCLLLAAPVAAQQVEPRVMVPERPGGVVAAGCYRADRNLYGPYRLQFCLQSPRGTYTVTGQGAACRGRANYTVSGTTIRVRLERSSCGNGQAWTAATISCRPQRLMDVILGEIFGRSVNQSGRVMVPDTPAVRTMRCTYNPDHPGSPNQGFTANRL
ncbi:MAG: hypothetical protein QM656_16190 [Paracoccaceae bacterium]